MSQRLPQTFLDSLPMGVFLLDEQGCWVQWNRWLAQHLEREPQPGQPVLEWVTPERRETLAHALQQVREHNPNLVLSYRLHRSLLLLRHPHTQAPLPHNLYLARWQTPRKGFRGIIGVVQDLTEREQTEAQLRAQIRFLELLASIGETLSQANAQGLDTALQETLQQLAAFFAADKAWLFVQDEHEQRLRCLAATGVPQQEAQSILPSPESVAVWVIRHMRPTVDTLPEGKAPLFQPLHPDSRSVLAAPFQAPRTVGVVVLEAERPHAFRQAMLVQVNAILQRLALSLALVASYQRERQMRQISETLREIGMRLTAEHDPESVQHLILDSVAQVVPYDSANIMAVEGDTVTIQAHRGYERFGVAEQIARFRGSLNDFTNLRHIARTHTPLIIPDVQADPHWINLEISRHIRSWIGVPILVHERLIGLLCLDKCEPGFYTPEHAEILTLFAHQAGLALENAFTHAEQYRQAITDPLTGVTNRRHLNAELKREIARAQRFRRPLSLLMIDVDDFKRYNDTYGHPEGDRVLRALALTLNENTRQIDLVARYGGEEFTIVLTETGLSEAVQVAERLRSAVHQLHKRFHLRAPVTVSIGVATYPQHGRTAEDLILAADVALYQAKHNGKDCVMPYRIVDTSVSEA